MCVDKTMVDAHVSGREVFFNNVRIRLYGKWGALNYSRYVEL